MVFFSSRQSDDLKTEIEKCQIRYDQLQFILQRQFMLIDITLQGIGNGKFSLCNKIFKDVSLLS